MSRFCTENNFSILQFIKNTRIAAEIFFRWMNCFWVDTCINHGRLVYWLCVVMTTVKQKKQVNFAYKRLACGFITLMSVKPNYSQFQNAKYSQNTVKICSTMFNEISENTEFVTALLKKCYILKIYVLLSFGSLIWLEISLLWFTG